MNIYRFEALLFTQQFKRIIIYSFILSVKIELIVQKFGVSKLFLLNTFIRQAYINVINWQ